MIRWVMAGLVLALWLEGCSMKEFNDGVEDAGDSVVRVIRGTNN